MDEEVVIPQTGESEGIVTAADGSDPQIVGNEPGLGDPPSPAAEANEPDAAHVDPHPEGDVVDDGERAPELDTIDNPVQPADPETAPTVAVEAEAEEPKPAAETATVEPDTSTTSPEAATAGTASESGPTKPDGDDASVEPPKPDGDDASVEPPKPDTDGATIATDDGETTNPDADDLEATEQDQVPDAGHDNAVTVTIVGDTASADDVEAPLQIPKPTVAHPSGEQRTGYHWQLMAPAKKQPQGRKPFKFQRDVGSFEERNIMFLTQVEKEVQVVKVNDDDQRNDDMDDGPRRVFSAAKRNEIIAAYSNDGGRGRAKIVQPMFKRAERKRIDLSRYEEDEDEALANKIPPRLRDMVTHPPESIVYRALAQVPMIGVPPRAVGQILMDLKVYLDKCVHASMIGESSYVECVIENIKIDQIESKDPGVSPTEQVVIKIEAAEGHYQRKKTEWVQQKNILEAEHDLALQDIELRYDEEATELDAEWNSEKAQTRFNKPSAQLITMRQHAKALINAHRFDEAAVLANMIRTREEEEAAEAGVRMNREYKAAQERLYEKNESERTSLNQAFETKMNGVLSAEGQDLRPFQQRIENLKKLKINTEIAEKRNAKNTSDKLKRRVPVSMRTGPISLNSKLKLPPLKSTWRRPRASVSALAVDDMPTITDN